MPGRSTRPTLELDGAGMRAHRERLSRMFRSRFACPSSGRFELEERRGVGSLQHHLRANQHTRHVINDRQGEEAAGLLCAGPRGELLCSFTEEWNASSSRYAFRSVSLRFFMRPSDHSVARQLFRLEWENDFPSETAAYPHWQFDRWLTASDGVETARLRSLFAGSGDVVRTFGEKAPIKQARPDLAWFTRLHFPAIAPWATHPISDFSSSEQPHRSRISAEKHIRQWVDCSLRYVTEQFRQYAT